MEKCGSETRASLNNSLSQSAVLAWFWNRQKEWKVLPLVEQRVQVATTRFRVPDITVLKADQPREAIITVPPLILIETLSKDSPRTFRATASPAKPSHHSR